MIDEALVRLWSQIADPAARSELVDLGLPVMDGYELARRLRQQSSAPALRLVAVTGYGQESDSLTMRTAATAAVSDRRVGTNQELVRTRFHAPVRRVEDITPASLSAWGVPAAAVRDARSVPDGECWRPHNR